MAGADKKYNQGTLYTIQYFVKWVKLHLKQTDWIIFKKFWTSKYKHLKMIYYRVLYCNTWQKLNLFTKTVGERRKKDRKQSTDEN